MNDEIFKQELIKLVNNGCDIQCRYCILNNTELKRICNIIKVDPEYVLKCNEKLR